MTIKSLMRLRPHRVVQEQQDGGHDQLTNHGGGFWSNLPPDILRDILIGLEASASRWPARRCLVACAGVCRSWRFVAKEVAGIPEISGRLTFPISVKQPGTRDRLIRCFIKRSRSALTYELYLNITDGLIDEGKLLLSAQKCKKATCTDYIISLSANVKTKDNATCVGKLRSNFIGTKFTILDEDPPVTSTKMSRSHSSRLASLKRASPVWSSGSHAIGHILYELNVLGVRGPRRMQCIMDSIPATAIEPGGIAPMQTELSFRNIRWPHSNDSTRRKESPSSTCPKQPDALVLRNKSPRWHENLQCWCLNFHGRVTVASVKNFQLLACPEDEKVILQFGKIEKDTYTMDYRYPLSAFQAFAICLSSFHTKIACEL